MSLVGALTKALKAGETAKKTAPFYSSIDEALANIARPKGTGAEFFTELTKQPGVKKAELADRKLEQAFKAKGKITKEEAQQVLKDNPPPQLTERVIDETAFFDSVAQELYGKPLNQIKSKFQKNHVLEEAKLRMDFEQGPQYSDYKIPGGDNYREILLKLPESKGVDNYQSKHWEGDPNVLAHMRVQDRTGPNGEKILHVEEIQSDWHQAGRKGGYADEAAYQEARQHADEVARAAGFEDAYQAAMGYQMHGMESAKEANDLLNAASRFKSFYSVPDAPFKKNWHELAMKRLLNYAADNGYDSIAITPGVEQAKRYDLTRVADAISYHPDDKGRGMFLNVIDKDNQVIYSKLTPESKIPSVIGQEMTQKLLAQEPNDGSRLLRGLDLELGGEGMKGFYDKMLPDYLNTFGKPYGAQVQPATFEVPVQSIDSRTKMTTAHPVHSFPITPQMREQIQQKGLPLYQQVGIPTAGAGAASQMLEPEEESGLATGGVVKSAVKQAQLAKLAKMRQEMAPRAEAVKALIARDENRYLRDVVPNSLTNAEIQAEIKRMEAKAPMIMKPSALTELRKIVEQEKGAYGARRLERAADEIPNLERMYQQEALRQAFTGDNAKALMTMNPADFEKYATPLVERARHWGNLGAGDPDKANLPTADYIKYLRTVGPFENVPFLGMRVAIVVELWQAKVKKLDLYNYCHAQSCVSLCRAALKKSTLML
jgi:hypothetical protein